jgi:hypothetical protein
MSLTNLHKRKSAKPSAPLTAADSARIERDTMVRAELRASQMKWPVERVLGEATTTAGFSGMTPFEVFGWSEWWKEFANVSQ